MRVQKYLMFNTFGEGYLCLLKRSLFLSIHRLCFIYFLREIYMKQVLQELFWAQFFGIDPAQMAPKYIWMWYCMHVCNIYHGFIWAVLMSGRQHKKLNLLIVFSNSIFIKFDVKAYWRWTCIQNKLAYKVSFYFMLFICHPDVKRLKFF